MDGQAKRERSDRPASQLNGTSGSGHRVIPTGSAVIVTSRSGRVLRGLVIGPDQQFFPRPRSVFVQFDSGRTRLIDVADLTVVPEEETLAADPQKRPPSAP